MPTRAGAVNERTFVLGAPTPAQLEMYSAVRGAIDRMMEVARPGVTMGELYATYRGFFEAAIRGPRCHWASPRARLYQP
jgi:Xaa-Pro aminopeptidase